MSEKKKVELCRECGHDEPEHRPMFGAWRKQYCPQCYRTCTVPVPDA